MTIWHSKKISELTQTMNKFNLEKQFMLFEKLCDGQLGIDALHMETNQTVKYRANEMFPMCSTYKLPIAICLLQQIENGLLKFNDYHDVTEYDIRPGIVGTLNQFSYTVPVKVSIENLLRLMLQESCNTSSDILLKIIGGPSSVMACLNKAGVVDMHVDRYILEIIAQWHGIKELPKNLQITLSQYEKLENQVPQADWLKAREQFRFNEKDNSTPQAMTLLLSKLFCGELMKKAHSELLIEIMRGCKRGTLRLMGLLPKGTIVAHKTGTLTGYTCDVGMMTLPHHIGHAAISVYIKNSSKDLGNNERVIAEVSRTLYDYFLFQ